MKIQFEIKIEIPEPGPDVVINESELVEKLYVLTSMIRATIKQQMPLDTKVKLDAYKGTERLHRACF